MSKAVKKGEPNRVGAKKLALCLCFALAAPQLSRAADSMVNKPAPEIKRLDLERRMFDLHAYRGKVVLLNFWATWCAPCQVEMPQFAAWQNEYGPRGLQVVGVSMDDGPQEAVKLSRKLRLNYPILMGDEELGRRYGGVLGLPLTYLVDKKGNIRAEFKGETDLNSIKTVFTELLGP